mgnify:CR=1 FL=1
MNIATLILQIQTAQNGRFAKQANLLRNATIIDKPWWFVVKKKDYCTTLWNTIYLCEAFHRSTPHEQCRWLIHEAVHLDQWKRKGSARMIAEYATKHGRERIEREAEFTAALWK